MNMSDVPDLFLSRKMPLNVAMIQVSPPDDFGWMSLGISVDVTMAAATSADMVIAQINPRMPRIMGQSFIHVNYVDFIVEHEEELLAIEADVNAQIQEMLRFSVESPVPEVCDALTHVYEGFPVEVSR